MTTDSPLPLNQKLANFIRQVDMIVDRVQDADPEWAIPAETGIAEIKKVCVNALNLLQKEKVNVQVKPGFLSRCLSRLRWWR